MEARRGNDRKVRFSVVFQLFRGRADQQLMDKEVLARQFIDDPELFGAGRIGAGEAVEHIQLAVLQIGGHLGTDRLIFFERDRTVHLAPGDLIVDLRNIHNELVIRRTAGILTGFHTERAGIAQDAFSALQRFLNEFGRGHVAVDRSGIDNAQAIQIHYFHCFLLRIKSI